MKTNSKCEFSSLSRQFWITKPQEKRAKEREVACFAARSFTAFFLFRQFPPSSLGSNCWLNRSMFGKGLGKTHGLGKKARGNSRSDGAFSLFSKFMVFRRDISVLRTCFLAFPLRLRHIYLRRFRLKYCYGSFQESWLMRTTRFLEIKMCFAAAGDENKHSRPLLFRL